MKKPLYFLSLTILVSISFMQCEQKTQDTDLLVLFTKYYEAVTNHDDGKWNYTSDSVKVWFGKNDTIPSYRFKGKPISKWGEWDNVMNSRSYYDSIWYNPQLHAVQGYFYENNDFYELIGASPSKSLRTYTFDQSNKITDVLYEFLPGENTISDEHLDPIYEWALKNDSLEISELYPNKEFVPSTENAIRWKELINRYKASNQ